MKTRWDKHWERQKDRAELYKQVQLRKLGLKVKA